MKEILIIMGMSVLLVPFLVRAQEGEEKTFREAQQEVQAAKDAYLRSRADVVMQMRRARPVQATTTTDQAGAVVANQSDTFLGNAALLLMRHIETTRRMLARVPDVDEGVREEFENDLDSLENRLRSVQRSLNEPLGRAERKRLARELKGLWQDGKVLFKRMIATVRAERIRGASEALFAAVPPDTLDRAGTLKTSITEDLASAHEKIVRTAEPGTDTHKLFIEGNADIRRALLRLKELARFANMHE